MRNQWFIKGLFGILKAREEERERMKIK